jgi:hypothetical protein
MLIIKDKLNIFGSNLIIDGGQTLWSRIIF